MDGLQHLFLFQILKISYTLAVFVLWLLDCADRRVIFNVLSPFCVLPQWSGLYVQDIAKDMQTVLW